MLDGRKLGAPGIKLEQGLMLPLRAVVEAVGGQVAWNAQTQSITAEVNGHRLHLSIGKRAAELDGQHLSLPQDPVLHGTNAMIPAHLLEQLTGWHVKLTAHTIHLVRP